jgi:ribose-phosphate pyrophosphokinase
VGTKPSSGFHIFAGSRAMDLAQKIGKHIGREVSDALVDRWKNGEVRVQLRENVRGSDVFIVQVFDRDVNGQLMELLLMLDAARRASVRQVTAVVPYFPYAKQEQKFRGREPISARLVADMITCAGADRVLTVDLHQGAIQGFFKIPVDHLPAQPVMAEALLKRGLAEQAVVVSPDSGGVVRAMDLAARIGCDVAVVFKRHPDDQPDEAVGLGLEVVGNIKDRKALILDDMILGGSTLANAAESLISQGAAEVYACVTHPVLCGDAGQRVADSCIKTLLVSDSIPLTADAPANIEVVTLAPLLGGAIERIHSNSSVSLLISDEA